MSFIEYIYELYRMEKELDEDTDVKFEEKFTPVLIESQKTDRIEK